MTNPARLKQQISENAREIARLNARIHEACKTRDNDPATLAAWRDACSEFHARDTRSLCNVGKLAPKSTRRFKMKLPSILAATLLTLVCGAANSQARATLKACVERASTDSAHYPQRIDRETTITGVSCRELDHRVVYKYDNRLDIQRSQLPSDALLKQKTAIRTMLCTNPQLTALLKLVDMEYAYYDAANVYIGSIHNRIEDCARTEATTASAQASDGASRWALVNRRADGKAVLEIDRASVIRQGGSIKVWTRAVYDTPFAVLGSSAQSRKVLSLVEMHCAKRTEQVRRVLFLDGEDRPILGTERGPHDVADIVPGSSFEAVFTAVCAAPPSRKQ